MYTYGGRQTENQTDQVKAVAIQLWQSLIYCPSIPSEPPSLSTSHPPYPPYPPHTSHTPHTLHPPHSQCILARQVAWSSTRVILARHRGNTNVSAITLDCSLIPRPPSTSKRVWVRDYLDCYSGHVILWLLFVFSEAGRTQEGVGEVETRALETCQQIARQELWNHTNMIVCFRMTSSFVQVLLIKGKVT